MSKNRRQFLTFSLWAGLGLWLQPPLATAQEQPPIKPPVDGAVELAARDLAEKISNSENIKPGSTIAVGRFSAPTSNQGGGGAEIQQALVSALQNLPNMPFKVNNQKYDVELTGKYFHDEIPGQGGAPAQPFERVRVSADDPKGNSLDTFETTILGVEAVPRLRGLSVTIPAQADDNVRAEKLKEATEKPAPPPEGTNVKPAPNSDFSLELLLKGEDGQFAAVTPALVDGQVFAKIPKGTEYHIVIKNKSKAEVAVALSIDGLSVFQFSQVQPAPNYWIVPADGETKVTGWFGTETKANAFLAVEDFSKTARAFAGLQPSDDVGLIHAAICPSSDKPFKGARGTALGRELITNVQKVNRFIGNPIAHISVRYKRK